MLFEIRGVKLPGRSFGTCRNLSVGLQRGREVVDVRSAEGEMVCWTVEVDLRERPDGAFDVRGPYVQGRPDERFLYLSWGETDDSGSFSMVRRIKLLFADVEPDMLAAAHLERMVLTATLNLTGRDGTPRCGSVRPPEVSYAVAHSPPL